MPVDYAISALTAQSSILTTDNLEIQRGAANYKIAWSSILGTANIWGAIQRFNSAIKINTSEYQPGDWLVLGDSGLSLGYIDGWYVDINHNLYYSGGWRNRLQGSTSSIQMGGGQNTVGYIDMLISQEGTSQAADSLVNLNKILRLTKDGAEFDFAAWVTATKKLGLNAGLTTYLTESSAGVLDIYANSRKRMSIGPGNIEINSVNDGDEGGEIVLKGAGTNIDWNIDNFQGNLRVLTTSATDKIIDIANIGAGVVTFQLDGGLAIGSPTGGYKGAGTANFAGDIYKNNTAYTNPDYVFEKYYTGKIEKYIKNEGAAEYTGIKTIQELENYVRNNHRFPQITDEPVGVFARSDKVLLIAEELVIYLFEHEKRLQKLEQVVKA